MHMCLCVMVKKWNRLLFCKFELVIVILCWGDKKIWIIIYGEMGSFCKSLKIKKLMLSISHHKSCSFCTRLYYVAIETMTHVKHDTCNKVTFVLSSDRIAIRLLVDLAIDLKQFRKLVIYRKSYSSTLSCTPIYFPLEFHNLKSRSDIWPERDTPHFWDHDIITRSIQLVAQQVSKTMSVYFRIFPFIT